MLFLVVMMGLGLVMPSSARAQGGEVLDAGAPDAAASGKPAAGAGAGAGAGTAPTGLPAPPPTATEEPTPRPARGPSVRERGGRRSRGGSVASGALMLVILVGFMGYYVVKRLRR